MDYSDELSMNEIIYWNSFYLICTIYLIQSYHVECKTAIIKQSLS